MKEVIIVGAGIGGLCTAIRLLAQGYKVTILEKENTVGGKINIKKGAGFKFDLTASIMMTVKSYTDIFQEAGRDYREYFELIKVDPIYNVNYYDGTNHKFYSDIEKMKDSLEKIQGGLSKEYEKFLFKTLDMEIR